jgi:hypothetical protein
VFGAFLGGLETAELRSRHRRLDVCENLTSYLLMASAIGDFLVESVLILGKKSSNSLFVVEVVCGYLLGVGEVVCFFLDIVPEI